VAAVLEVANGLHVSIKAKVSGGLNHGAVNKPLVRCVVDLGESVVVGARDAKGWGKAHSSESEEVGHVHEADCVDG